MADTFPQSHTTTTTTVHATTVTSGGRVYFDASYIKTLPAILQIVQIVLSLIVFICSVAAQGFGAAGWGAFVGFTGFILTIGWLVFHLFHVYDTVPHLPWYLFEMIYYIIYAVFFFIAGCVLAAMSNDYAYGVNWYGGFYSNYYKNIHSAAGAGSFFAFAAMIVFGIGAFFCFRSWRMGRVSGPPRA